jgi:LAO/AO transport system kinase
MVLGELVSLVTDAIAGSRKALARSITRLELRDATLGFELASAAIRRRLGPGEPHVVGITGPPGAGKSTFVDQMVATARLDGKTVAVVAVDPSSPFSGGAILGDRIRMERHTSDDGVFVRSMSSRGHLGGLSGAVSDVVDLLDAAGFDAIIVETVGVGQSELSVVEVADTVVVVLTPESGDTVQTMKAGLLEIADVFVVNKADRSGAERLATELSRSIALVSAPWQIPVHVASALHETGVDDVVASTAAHLTWCVEDGRADWVRRRGEARIRRYLDIVAEAARTMAMTRLDGGLADALRSGQITPHQAAKEQP